MKSYLAKCGEAELKQEGETLHQVQTARLKQTCKGLCH